MKGRSSDLLVDLVVGCSVDEVFTFLKIIVILFNISTSLCLILLVGFYNLLVYRKVDGDTIRRLINCLIIYSGKVVVIVVGRLFC